MSKLDLSVNLKMIDKITEPAKRAQAALGGASGAINKLQTSLKNTKAMQKNLQAFEKTTQQAAKNRKVINDLNQVLKTKGKLTDSQNKKLKSAKALSTKYAASLRSQSAALKKVGLSTKNLRNSEAALQKSQAKSLKQIKKLNDRTKRLAKLRSKLGKVAKIGAIGGAVGIAGVVKLGGVLRSTADELDKMTKAAKNMKLPLDQFQALRHQADLAGVSNEALTKSYQTFNKNLGELKTKKSSLLSTALKDFNPELMAKMKNSKNSTQAYEHVLEAMQKIPDASKQAALANAVFGRNGKDMLLMLREGNEGLIKAKKELAALGGGANAEDAKAAEDFNDSITRMGQAFDTIKFSAFTPVLKELTQMFDGLIGKMKDKAWRDDITAKLKAGLQAVMSVIKSVVKIFEALAPVLKFVTDNLLLTTSAVVGTKTAMLGLKIATIAPKGAMLALATVSKGTLSSGLKLATKAFNIMKVALLTNPITAIITGIAVAAYLIYDNWKGIAEFFSNMWSSIKATWYDGVASVLESLTGLLSNIPDFLLPKSWEGDNLKSTIASYREIAKLAEDSKKTQALSAKIDTTATQRIITDTASKQLNSKVDVLVKIDSQIPATVEKAKSTGISSLNLDVGSLATAY